MGIVGTKYGAKVPASMVYTFYNLCKTLLWNISWKYLETNEFKIFACASIEPNSYTHYTITSSEIRVIDERSQKSGRRRACFSSYVSSDINQFADNCSVLLLQ